MKITVCIRCQTWRTSGHNLSERNKSCIFQLNSQKLLDVEYKNEVCDTCRCGIGDEVSERLLKIFNDEKPDSS